jgi:hypothetical protein
MSDWFFMLGEPLTTFERQRIRDYLTGLEIGGDYPIEELTEWRSALEVMTSPTWDRHLWEADQREVRRLLERAHAGSSPAQVRASLSAAVNASEPAHGAAAVAAARLGCTDVGFIRAAAGAASEAAYQSELARLAGETDRHPFTVKQHLFAGGHWPLGFTSGRYYTF